MSAFVYSEKAETLLQTSLPDVANWGQREPSNCIAEGAKAQRK
ncbi:hypothetical protein [Dulcicalothrix desertica]|nr:hypothetical protein [Dulcicalothrix desertica]